MLSILLPRIETATPIDGICPVSLVTNVKGTALTRYGSGVQIRTRLPLLSVRPFSKQPSEFSGGFFHGGGFCKLNRRITWENILREY
jgi:hypothetical protein